MLLFSSSAPSSYYMQAGASSSVFHGHILHLCRGRLDIQPMTYYNQILSIALTSTNQNACFKSICKIYKNDTHQYTLSCDKKFK